VKDARARKEKSIRELAVKFIGLFMQAAVSSSHVQGALSLEQAARSLLVHERGGAEPDSGAMKTKVRRRLSVGKLYAYTMEALSAPIFPHHTTIRA